jgi:hypothetical protein
MCAKNGRLYLLLDWLTVVERTNSWHNNFRALRIRWETKATHYMALVHRACALIAYRAATRRNGPHF